MNNILKAGGIFTFEQIRNGEIVDTWSEHNIVVDTGLNYLLDVALSAGAANATHYIGLFSNNYTPISTTLIADLTEITSKYTEATRPAWTEAGVSAKTITNSASPATFTFNQAENAYGAFLSSSNVKGGVAGTLVAAVKFSAARAMQIDDVLKVTYTLSASSS